MLTSSDLTMSSMTHVVDTKAAPLRQTLQLTTFNLSFHAYEMHAHEMYAHDVHGYEVHAEMYAYETHAVLHKLASWRTGTQIIISVVGFWAYAPREFLILGNLGKQM